MDWVGSTLMNIDFELIKGGGIWVLLAYLIYTERQGRGKEVEADIARSEASKKNSEAQMKMAEATKSLVDFFSIERKIERNP